MTAAERVARMLFDDEHTMRGPTDPKPTREQLDAAWADLPTDLGPDHGVHHYLGRARRYLEAAVSEALDPEIDWQREKYGDGTDKVAVGRLIGLQDAAEALRRERS